MIIAAPASTSARANSGAFSEHSSQPARCLTVTGMRAGTVRRTAATSSAASAGSRISAEPQAPAVTFFAGQPMLMSTIEAPTSTAMPAARASASGSRPKIWTAKRRPPKLGHIRPIALAAPRVSASADRNSVNVSAAPSSSHTVRNGRSVTASIGASRAPGLSWMSPMRMGGRENSIRSRRSPDVRASLRGRLPQGAAALARPGPGSAGGGRRGAARRRRRSLDLAARRRAPSDASARSRTSARTSTRAAGDAASPLVNTNAHYWTALAGIAWDRDVDIDFDREPVDLDGDGRARHAGHAAHPRQGRRAREPGAVRPDADARRSARARRAHLGVDRRARPARGAAPRRHAERRDRHDLLAVPRRAARGRRASCWACPATQFDYGLLLATAAVLDDANADAAAHRRARGFPSGRTVRARLLLAGPGRQDLTGEFGLDVTVPGYHSARYAGTARVRQGTRGIVNPISVPGILAAPGLALENWSGSEDAAAPWLERLIALAGRPAAGRARRLRPARRAIARRRAPRAAVRPAQPRHARAAARFVSRAALVRRDLRPRRAVRRRDRGDPADVRRRGGAQAARRAKPARGWRRTRPRRRRRGARRARARRSSPSGSSGTIANRQIFKHAPRAYAAAKIEGPVLAPIDATKPLDAKLAVRCADCHSAAPLENDAAAGREPAAARAVHALPRERTWRGEWRD